MRLRKAIFLDRDGVINVRLPDGAYVTKWEEFVFRDGAVEGMRLFGREGYSLIVVTNQRGIGRGIMTEDDLADIHGRMEAHLEREGVSLTAIYHCPHDHAARCGCRKPKPGMLLAAIEKFDIDGARSLIVGDSTSDIEAGRAAGVGGVLIVSEGGDSPAGERRARTLLEAARIITGAADDKEG
jgi:D-glycero-D-manno-heptose 1,7-bisphosphate phosphatase